MSVCTVRRGFFVLRDCGAAATGMCATCARPVCQEHGVLVGAALHCVECRARENAPVNDPAWHERATPFVHRQRFYSGGHYSPIYTGHHHHWHSSYDDYDVRSFDNDRVEYLGAGDDDDAGFLDS